MRSERTVQQHPVVQHRTLILEIGQPHPAILAQRFGIIGLRQGEQGQLILPNLCVMDLGADGVRVLSWKFSFAFSTGVAFSVENSAYFFRFCAVSQLPCA